MVKIKHCRNDTKISVASVLGIPEGRERRLSRRAFLVNNGKLFKNLSQHWFKDFRWDSLGAFNQFERQNGFWANGPIIPKPGLRAFWGGFPGHFGGDSLTKPPFGVTSAEVAIIWPEFMFPLIFGLRNLNICWNQHLEKETFQKNWHLQTSMLPLTVQKSGVHRSPVEIGGLSPLFTSVFDIPGGFCLGFFSPSTVVLTY